MSDNSLIWPRCSILRLPAWNYEDGITSTREWDRWGWWVLTYLESEFVGVLGTSYLPASPVWAHVYYETPLS